MEVDEHVNGSEIPGEDQPGRWSHVRKLLERRGPFSHENMNASPEMFDMIRNNVKVLVIGQFIMFHSISSEKNAKEEGWIYKAISKAQKLYVFSLKFFGTS